MRRHFDSSLLVALLVAMGARSPPRQPRTVVILLFDGFAPSLLRAVWPRR
jgi:hypothetical protein